MNTRTAGFTLVEVMVAIVILAIGLLALGGATANVSKMAGFGKWTTVASQVATRRLENIRQIAYSTTPPCTSTALIGGGPIAAGSVTEAWRITGTGQTRLVTIVVTYPRSGRQVSDSVVTVLRCN